ncbi:methyltransferase domain-containing protein [Amycolatopsis sp. NEAU-NG30]|uniref:Protein-L-isoaspartate O-methyltransferase n=1 Tax=Amycolatopsis melonis TaxID=3156488 RepID=A0ABV0LGY5_9PSEU
MMTTAEVHWRDRAADLADDLARTGDVTDPAWLDAIRGTPRHELVPVFFQQLRPGRWTSTHVGDQGGRPASLAAAYSDAELAILLDRSVRPAAVLSTAIRPRHAARTLQALDVHPGHRVLHVGTGSGYLTALLCRRLGDQDVMSLDIEPALVDLAAARLAAIGHTPTVQAGHAWDGLPEHGPVDRIVATCALPSIPPSWLSQLGTHGIVVAELRLGPGAATLVRLARQAPDRIEGRFHPAGTAFAPLRPCPGRSSQHTAAWIDHDTSSPRSRWSTIAPDTPWLHDPEVSRVTWFLAALDLGMYEVRHQRRPQGFPPGHPAIVLDTPDGSWARIDTVARDGEHHVIEGGPRRLWAVVERAHRWWRDLGRPGWARFGLTVTPTEHTIWLDQPDGEHRWTRPTPTSASAWRKT